MRCAKFPNFLAKLRKSAAVSKALISVHSPNYADLSLKSKLIILASTTSDSARYSSANAELFPERKKPEPKARAFPWNLSTSLPLGDGSNVRTKNLFPNIRYAFEEFLWAINSKKSPSFRPGTARSEPKRPHPKIRMRAFVVVGTRAFYARSASRTSATGSTSEVIRSFSRRRLSMMNSWRAGVFLPM
jgi:hypothetical protein